MKAWRLERLGGALTFEDVPVPEPRPHSVLVRIEAVRRGYGRGAIFPNLIEAAA